MLDNYKDIITEIDLSKVRIEGLEEEGRNLMKLMYSSEPKSLKAMSYDGMPKGSKNDTPLDKIIADIMRVKHAISIEEDRIEILNKTKEKMDKKLEELQGLKYKIAYMRMQGYTLSEIADKLKYNESYIRRVAASIKKEEVNIS